MVLDEIFGAIGDAIGAVVEGVGDVTTDVVSDGAMDALGDSIMEVGDGITDSTDGRGSGVGNDDLNVIKNTLEASINVDKNVVNPTSLTSDKQVVIKDTELGMLDTEQSTVFETDNTNTSGLETKGIVIATGIASTKPKEKQQSETDQQLDN